jgi:predicted HAD superfamily Cof-like phosphohydrolase
MSKQTNFQMVNEFHRVFGHTSNTIPQLNILTENPKLIKFRISMILEEYNELKEAIKVVNFKESIDAICDMLYFIYGTYDAMGINFDKTTNYKFQEYELDGCNFNIFDIYEFDLEHHVEYIHKNINMLTKYANDTLITNQESQLPMFLLHLTNIERTCRTLGTLFGVSIDRCFEEVHRSNMTKLCKSEEEAIATVDSYKKLLEEGKSAYKQPEFRLDSENGYWIVYDAETSKILKSINFELPKFYFE